MLLCTYLPKLKEAYICAIRIKQNPVQKESQPASWNFSSHSSDCSDTFSLASCVSETDHHMPFPPHKCFTHITLMKGTLMVCTLNIYKYICTYNTILFTLHITNFMIVWPCIITDSLWIKPTDALNSNFIGTTTTLHVSGSLSAHHREFLAVHQLWYILCSCDEPFASRSRMELPATVPSYSC